MALHHCPACDKDFIVPDWLKGPVNCPNCRAAVETTAPAGPGGSSASSRPGSDDGSAIAAVPPSSESSAKPAASAFPLPSARPGASQARRPGALFPAWMGSIFRNNKWLLFGVIGAVGCFIGAILGELWLAATRVSAATPAQAVCLVIDCSGSMSTVDAGAGGQTRLQAVKAAAKEFCRRQKGTNNQIALVAFGTRPEAKVAPPRSYDDAILDIIDKLRNMGNTNMDLALAKASEILNACSLPRHILLFTDGRPAGPPRVQAMADQCRSHGIDIVAIATAEANHPSVINLLAGLTGDPKRVISATAGRFGDSFEHAETIIYHSLVEKGPMGGGVMAQTARIGVWTGLLALGVALALIIGQNVYLKRSSPAGSILLGGLGGFAAGCAGGCVGEILLSGLPAYAVLLAMGTVLGWIVFGAILGAGMGLFVPNLAVSRSWIGGAVGAGLGALGYLVAAIALGDTVGRLLGAVILGFAIGLLIAIIETAFRKAWLEVWYGPKETVRINLGANPVSFGSDSKACTVFVFGTAPVAYRYRMANNAVECEDVHRETWTTVQPGDRRQIGNATVIVRAAGGAESVGQQPSSPLEPVAR